MNRRMLRSALDADWGDLLKIWRAFSKSAGKPGAKPSSSARAWRRTAMRRALLLVRDSGGIDLAASLAYFTVLSFFPFVTLLIIAFAHIADSAVVGERIKGIATIYFPASSDLLQEVIDHLVAGSLTVGVLALAGMAFSANGLYMAASRSVNRIFGTRMRKPVRTVALELGVGALVVVIYMLSMSLSAMLQLGMGIGGTGRLWLILNLVVSAALPAALIGMVFIVFYRYLPNAAVHWRDAAFGGIVAIVMFEVARHGFFWFTNMSAQASLVYGPIASVVLLLMWAYIAGLIFLYGAALTRVARELRPVDRPAGPPRKSP